MSDVANAVPSTERANELVTRNLAALDRVDPELAERLRLPVDGSRTRWRDGRLLHRVHRQWVVLDVAAEKIAAEVRGVHGARRVCVLGVGAGEIVLRLLAAGVIVVAWERDPWILRLFLMTHDAADAIANGQLVPKLGTDLFDIEPTDTVLEHPVLRALYAGELRTWRRSRKAARAVVCEGGLFVGEVRRALEASGRATWILDVCGLAREESAREMRRLRPEVVVAINYTEGLVAFCAEHGAKLVVWEVDPSTALLLPVDGETEHAHVFTYRAAHVELFRAAGIEHVEYLPLAADEELRRPLALDAGELEGLSAPLAYVGSSMVANAQACRSRLLKAWGEFDATSAAGEALEEVLDTQRQSFATFRIPELLEQAAPGFRAAALAVPGAEDPVLLAAEISASEKRLSWVANLGPHGLSVWGDAGWEATAAYGVRYRGPAGHRDALTRIYSACPLHVDIGRIYQPDIVTMRVFDVLACGRPILAEHSDALAELFVVGVEVESYRDVRELMAKVDHFRRHPDEARRIGEAGRDAVLAKHTIGARVAYMLSRI